MHIKKVTIEGFKSYRRRTVFELSEGLNLISGHNGAGKSNLLAAIEFVVSPEYLDMPQKKKEELISYGSPDLLPKASVEIVFEDDENRLKEGKKSETTLRREVTSGRDFLFCDNKAMNKNDFKSILRTAGFSKMNTYYIIKQGNASRLTDASDAGRLSLMKDVIGSSTWEEQKPQDLALMNDAAAQLEKSNKLIADLEKQVDSLRIEKDEYVRWKKISDRKNTLEFCIIRKDRKQKGKKMATLVERSSELEAEIRTAIRNEGESATVKNKLEEELETLKADLQNFKQNLVKLSQSLRECAVQETQLDCEIKERDNCTRRQTEEAATLNAKISTLDQEIAEKTLERDTIARECGEAVRERSRLQQGLILAEEEFNELVAQSVQTECYPSQEARDHALNQQRESLEQLRNKEQDELNLLSAQLMEDFAEKSRLDALCQDLEAKKKEKFNLLKTLKMEQVSCRDNLRRAQLHQNDLRRKLCELEKEYNESSRSYELTRRQFSTASSRSIANAILHVNEAVRAMLAEEEGSNAHQMATGYRGLVIDQFKPGEDLYTLLHAIAGNKLFEHVVDNEDVAIAIIDKMEQMKFDDAPVFHASNRVARRRYSLEKINEAFPVMDCFKGVKPEGEAVLNKIFGNWMMCRDFDTACDVASQLRCNCATSKGQTVMDNGMMKGGHYGDCVRRINLYYEVGKSNETVQRIKGEVDEMRNSLRAAEEEISMAIGKLQTTESAVEDVNAERTAEQLEHCKEKVAIVVDTIRGKEDHERAITLQISGINKKIEALNTRLHQPFNPELLAEERLRMETLRAEISRAKIALLAAGDRCHRLDLRKTTLDYELQENLLRMKRDLEKSLNDMLGDGNAIPHETDNENQQENIVNQMKIHLESLRSHSAEQSKVVEALEEKITLQRNMVKEKREKLDEAKLKLADMQRIVKEQRAQRAETERQIQVQEAKKKDYADRELDYDKEKIKRYNGMDRAKLEKKLASANRKLKTFTSLNMRAALDYDSKQPKIEELKKKAAKLQQENEQGRDLIQRVDDVKNDAMQFSLVQIAKGFESVFNAIVPKPAWGRLRWVYEGVDENSEDEESEQPGVPDMDRLTGIAIDVSFCGRSQVRNTKCLSGGQKSLVSLSLVFAILLMDRAPFYIFDESDMALDDKYRSAIAEKVGELARGSQFIVTTFRAELTRFAETRIHVSYDQAAATSSLVVLPPDEIDDSE